MTLAADLKELMLRRPALTLAVAESVTAGHLQAQIASASGASEFFLGGVTAYTLDQKVRVLGVSRAPARAVNCVSQRVALEMAAGAAKFFGADLAAATTGYAEPAQARKIKAPMAWWAICHRRKKGPMAFLSGQVEISQANRTEAQELFARAVLVELVRYLGEIKP